MTSLMIETLVRDRSLYEKSLPVAATAGSAGLDLLASRPEIIPSGCTVSIDTGLNIWIKDPTKVGLVFARSGLGTRGLILANGTGVIDSDYQGPIVCYMRNESPNPMVVNRGDRIAQIVFVDCHQATLERVEKFSDLSDRGVNGFGSTGK